MPPITIPLGLEPEGQQRIYAEVTDFGGGVHVRLGSASCSALGGARNVVPEDNGKADLIITSSSVDAGDLTMPVYPFLSSIDKVTWGSRRKAYKQSSDMRM